ncbi:MAG: porin family protein [Bacteroidia bacterium]|nr:porin family protein [Bacteroidia bacterium]
MVNHRFLKQNLIIPAQVLIVLTVLTLNFSTLFAQENSTEKRNQHQIGVNASYFFKQFLNLGSSNSLSISPYILSYKIVDRKHHGFRMGAGLSMQSSNQNPDSTNSVKNSTSAYNLRFGYEYQKELGPKWLCFFGADGLFNYALDKTTTNNGFDKVSNTDVLLTYGGGPVLGFQYNISKHISLFTETGIYALVGQSVSKSSFTNNPQFNEETKTNVSSVSFLLPTSLFLVVRF